MSTLSKTDMAILGLLTIEPMSGYDLKKVCEKSLAHFWHASYGNLYPRLRKLVESGHVTRRREPRSDAPDAFVYTIRRSGLERLRAWIREPTAAERVHSELVLKVFLGSNVDPAVLQRVLDEHEQDQQAARANLEEAEQSLRDVVPENPDAVFWLMTLQRGLLLNRARLQWCRESRTMIAEMKKRGASHVE